MPYKMNEIRFEAALMLDSFQRFNYFLSKVADWKQMWGVKSDKGWLIPVSPENFEYFPLWPHPEYAQKIADDNFPGYKATEISLQDLLEHWLPLFEKKNVKVAIFPNADWTFLCVEANDLKEKLLNKMSGYQ